MKFVMQCMRCGEAYTDDEAFNDVVLVCSKCTGPLAINIIHGKEIESIGLDFFREKATNMWKFFPFLPIRKRQRIITLGEGATPLLKSRNLASRLNVKNLYLKNETMNPTGSFIDRQISNGISAAKELGFSKAIALSTGNVGASVAAYCARAGFRNLVIVPKKYRKMKSYQIRSYGGNFLRIDSNTFKVLMDIVIESTQQFNAINLATTSLYNAFTNHGAKTIIYEIFEQMNLTLPDVILVPVGGAGLLSAIIQACLELKELDFIDEIPYFIAIQPDGCHPFIDALRKNLMPQEVYNKPWYKKNTIITALANDIPFDYYWFYFLRNKIPRNRVFGITVTDEEAMESQETLSRDEGIFVELASATTIAAFNKINEQIDKANEWNSYCAILTGSGLMEIEKAIQNLEPPAPKPLTSDWAAIMKRYFIP
ncbi:MAG: pyridoxal-phosphate dependent enzyme [Promethearchaeota archaeon]